MPVDTESESESEDEAKEVRTVGCDGTVGSIFEMRKGQDIFTWILKIPTEEMLLAPTLHGEIQFLRVA